MCLFVCMVIYWQWMKEDTQWRDIFESIEIILDTRR